MWLHFYGWKKINVIITVIKARKLTLSRIAVWDIIDFPALPLLGNFCYETVVFQIQIEGHLLHFWVQLLTPGYCHYTSFIFNTNGYNLSKLITIFCQMLISSKSVYTYIYIYIFIFICIYIYIMIIIMFLKG